MTKLSVAEPRDPPDQLVGILKYYVVGSLLALLVVGGVAYWTFAAH